MRCPSNTYECTFVLETKTDRPLVFERSLPSVFRIILVRTSRRAFFFFCFEEK
jgi:hypothetical protein